MKKLLINPNNKKFAMYAVPLLVLLSIELFAYQTFFFLPIKVNGKNYMARKGATAWTFLSKLEVAPKYGDLLAVNKKIYTASKGNPPIVYVNGKRKNFDYSLKEGDNIKTVDGTDITEPVVRKRVPVEKKIENYGQGSFIIIERKGKMGLKEVRFGKYSRVVISSRMISQPISTGISRINIRKRNVVALTFDDGPSIFTPHVLRILKKYKVKATFFVLGRNIRKYPNYLYRIKKNGHLIGNHTYNHISMQTSTAAAIKHDLKITDREIFRIAKIKSRWVRPPGGALRQSIINYVTMRGKNISLWNIDTADWKRPNPNIIVQKVVSGLKPGQVILLHDGGGDRSSTIYALPKLIREIKKRKFRFATLDDIYSTIRPYDN